MKRTNTAAPPEATPSHAASGVSRRRFLGYAGAFAGVGMLTLQACKNDDDVVTPGDTRVNLGSGDTGILNYAYALEQLEAAFYTEVINRAGSGLFSADETARLTEVRDHEVAHRNFFKAALGSSAIKDLTPDFSRVDFGNRTSILETARTFEDLGVAAYNGAGKLLTTPANLVLAGKIVSVEARHAAYIRDLISNGSFADLANLEAGGLGASNANGLDGALMPSQVLALADPFITDAINGDNLPK